MIPPPSGYLSMPDGKRRRQAVKKDRIVADAVEV